MRKMQGKGAKSDRRVRPPPRRGRGAGKQLCYSLRHCCLADPGLSDKHCVVLRAPHEDPKHPLQDILSRRGRRCSPR